MLSDVATDCVPGRSLCNGPRPSLHGRVFFRALDPLLSGGLECRFLLPLGVWFVARCTVGRIAHQVSCLIAKIKDGSRIGCSHGVNSGFGRRLPYLAAWREDRERTHVVTLPRAFWLFYQKRAPSCRFRVWWRGSMRLPSKCERMPFLWTRKPPLPSSLLI